MFLFNCLPPPLAKAYGEPADGNIYLVNAAGFVRPGRPKDVLPPRTAPGGATPASGASSHRLHSVPCARSRVWFGTSSGNGRGHATAPTGSPVRRECGIGSVLSRPGEAGMCSESDCPGGRPAAGSAGPRQPAWGQDRGHRGSRRPEDVDPASELHQGTSPRCYASVSGTAHREPRVRTSRKPSSRPAKEQCVDRVRASRRDGGPRALDGPGRRRV